VSKYVKNNTVFVVGGFPRGGFSPDVVKKFNVMVAIHEMPLETHTVLARVIYDYERLRRQV
jgi:rRNA pseudouridine-1189 N-methylase Emg1 (Nep1/Mra1 family)